VLGSACRPCGVLRVPSARLAKVGTVLDREMYTEAAAARLLRVAPATLHYWLEGGTRGTKTYQPVIRETATGNRRVTWAEFVEAGLLREYRKSHNVPMLELRAFIRFLRDRLGVPYPLAHARPFVSGRQLVWQAQQDSHLAPDFALVAEVTGQYMLLPPAESFYQRVTWKDDIAMRWRPDEYPDSPVVIDPSVRFGSPTVHGIRTETLWEQSQGGEDEQDLAERYGLTVADVRRALAYELATEAA
jgi:uncharacterized protein (DUF433 family)